MLAKTICSSEGDISESKMSKTTLVSLSHKNEVFNSIYNLVKKAKEIIQSLKPGVTKWIFQRRDKYKYSINLTLYR